jgi:hypothetical protein
MSANCDPTVRDSFGNILSMGAVPTAADLARAMEEYRKDNPVLPSVYTEREACRLIGCRPEDLVVLYRAGLSQPQWCRITTDPVTRKDTGEALFDGAALRQWLDNFRAASKIVRVVK